MNNFEKLETLIKSKIPEFKYKLKKDSFMKFVPFNKKATITLGRTVYFYELNKDEKDFRTLAHEYVHVYDYNKGPVKFLLKYTFPQILSLLALFSVFSNFFLFFLLFLLPIPSLTRSKLELKAYLMNMMISYLKNEHVNIDEYLNRFNSLSYYFMCPFKEYLKKQLESFKNVNFEPYNDVKNIIK